MRVSIDGGITWMDHDNVRVEYPNFDGDGSALCVNLTHEGAILDIVNRSERGEITATAALDLDTLAEMTQ